MITGATTAVAPIGAKAAFIVGVSTEILFNAFAPACGTWTGAMNLDAISVLRKGFDQSSLVGVSGQSALIALREVVPVRFSWH